MIGTLYFLSLGDFYLTTMTREEKIISAMCDNLSTKNNSITGTNKAADAISHIFDEERDQFAIEFAEWCADNDWIKEYAYMERCWRNKNTDRFGTDYKTTAELLQLFKNRYSPDNQ